MSTFIGLLPDSLPYTRTRRSSTTPPDASRNVQAAVERAPGKIRFDETVIGPPVLLQVNVAPAPVAPRSAAAVAPISAAQRTARGNVPGSRRHRTSGCLRLLVVPGRLVRIAPDADDPEEGEQRGSEEQRQVVDDGLTEPDDRLPRVWDDGTHAPDGRPVQLRHPWVGGRLPLALRPDARLGPAPAGGTPS